MSGAPRPAAPASAAPEAAPAARAAAASAAPAEAARDASLLALAARWEAQQAAYIAAREARFDALLDVLELAGLPGSPLVLDLACGTGSLARRVLARVPSARVVAVDCDPVLLRIAHAALAEHGERARTLDADLADPAWVDQLAGAQPHAVVSSTALHWLGLDALARVYEQAAELLAPGGVLLNADHLRLDGRRPWLRDVAAAHDAATQRAAFAAGADSWERWWEDAAALPELAPLVAERERRFAGRPPQPETTVELHVELLLRAGFGEAAPVWQLLDDYVVCARR